MEKQMTAQEQDAAMDAFYNQMVKDAEKMDEVLANALDSGKVVFVEANTCKRCCGTGKFITYIENDQPKGPGGICFRCRGKGYQTKEDEKRNDYYDSHRKVWL